MGEVIVASPFKGEMEKNSAPSSSRTWKRRNSFRRIIVDDQVEEAELVNQYMKTRQLLPWNFGRADRNYGL